MKTFRKYISEAEYQGRKVELDNPFRTPDGPKKFSVYVKNEKGNVVKVNFGDPNMEIKRDDPARRKSFRARHNCDDPGPKWKARYWSCYQWRAGSKVDEGVKQDSDIKDKKGTQPAKYYAGDMSKSTKEKRAAHFAKKKSGPAPGDASAETKPSKHTKKYKQMFGEEIEGLKNKLRSLVFLMVSSRKSMIEEWPHIRQDIGQELQHNNGHSPESIVSLRRVKEHGVVRIKT